MSGIDLYALDDGKWKWVEVSRPKEVTTTHVVTGLDPALRTYLAYLPLYNSTVMVEVGVPKGATFQPVAPRKDKPIVFYGTSITHGASASRPGMPHPAILDDASTNRSSISGFPGNGKMEPEVGALLTEIDAAVYVIDCLPNMTEPEVAERAEALVRQLREARPDTPIILVEDRTYANTWIMKSKRDRHAGSRSAFVRAYDNLVKSGVKGLSYVEGEALLGDDTEGTTDGSHPNDLGSCGRRTSSNPTCGRRWGWNDRNAPGIRDVFHRFDSPKRKRPTPLKALPIPPPPEFPPPPAPPSTGLATRSPLFVPGSLAAANPRPRRPSSPRSIPEARGAAVAAVHDHLRPVQPDPDARGELVGVADEPGVVIIVRGAGLSVGRSAVPRLSGIGRGALVENLAEKVRNRRRDALGKDPSARGFVLVEHHPVGPFDLRDEKGREIHPPVGKVE